MRSQNASFKAIFPEDAEFDHPPGAWFARKISDGVAVAGWNVSEFDNWRDVGWSVPCFRDNSKLEVVFASSGDEWMLQVAAIDSPGLFRSLFGAKPSATTGEIVSVAKTLDGILKDESRISDVMWRIDGPPEKNNSTGEPEG